MLTEEEIKRAQREVERQTQAYKDAKSRGYAARAMGMSTYDTQEDFERCRPDSRKGTDFQSYNEYVAEVIKGLLANGVPAEPVIVRHAEFEKFLQGNPITPQSRATFAAHLVGEPAKKESK